MQTCCNHYVLFVAIVVVLVGQVNELGSTRCGSPVFVCNSKRNNNVEKIVASEKRVVQSPPVPLPPLHRLLLQ